MFTLVQVCTLVAEGKKALGAFAQPLIEEKIERTLLALPRSSVEDTLKFRITLETVGEVLALQAEWNGTQLTPTFIEEGIQHFITSSALPF